jgi:hypothetical protein
MTETDSSSQASRFKRFLWSALLVVLVVAPFVIFVILSSVRPDPPRSGGLLSFPFSPSPSRSSVSELPTPVSSIAPSSLPRTDDLTLDQVNEQLYYLWADVQKLHQQLDYLVEANTPVTQAPPEASAESETRTAEAANEASERLSELERVILESPERAVQIPLMTQDIRHLNDKVDLAFSLIIGTVVAFVMGIAVTVAVKWALPQVRTKASSKK